VNLPFYSSTSNQQEPNLVGLQHPLLAVLPTQLVCPLREEICLTPLCKAVLWNGIKYIVACDLILPINRKGLHSIGFLDEETSARILKTFQRMLATVAP